jgi:hypothetical protein
MVANSGLFVQFFFISGLGIERYRAENRSVAFYGILFVARTLLIFPKDRAV